MKRIIILILLLGLTSVLNNVTNANNYMFSPDDTVSMEPGYANDVYYALDNGAIHSVVRNNWDISFSTTTLSSTIRTNDGAGVLLYTYPNADTSGWATIDTAGISNWQPMINSDSSWDGSGAFDINASGHPDYGWGVYNMFTHRVTGDSLYVIQLVDGTFKKLWIIEKDSPNNINYFRYANLDGTNDTTIALDCSNYTDKLFLAFSISNNQAVDREPTVNSWDMVFTKYIAQVSGTPYPVTGVLANEGVLTAELNPVDTSITDWTTGIYTDYIGEMGYDWKYFDMGIFSYIVNDSTVFFVKTLNDDIFKIIYTFFQGSSTGKVAFIKEKLSTVSINEQEKNDFVLSVYPNPVVDQLNLIYSSEVSIDLNLRIVDITGKNVYQEEITSNQPGLNTKSISTKTFVKGIYFITLSSKDHIINHKIIVK